MATLFFLETKAFFSSSLTTNLALDSNTGRSEWSTRLTPSFFTNTNSIRNCSDWLQTKMFASIST